MAVILVVDDYESTRDLVEYILTKEGHYVITAKDGEEGLVIVGARDVDLVMTDLSMPKMTGIELAQALRGNPQTETIPIIFITSTHNMGDLEKAMEQCDVPYAIAGQVTREKILEVVEKALQGSYHPLPKEKDRASPALEQTIGEIKEHLIGKRGGGVP